MRGAVSWYHLRLRAINAKTLAGEPRRLVTEVSNGIARYLPPVSPGISLYGSLSPCTCISRYPLVFRGISRSVSKFRYNVNYLPQDRPGK